MTTGSPPVRPADADSDHALVIERTFDAPRALVWRAWTEPEHVARWWGPRGFTTRVEALDLRTGGRSHYVMIGPDGAEYPASGTFREVVPGEKIVTTDEFGDGNEPPNPDLPQGMILTCLFEELDGGARTRLTLHISHPTAEDRRKHEEMGVVAGWGSSLDCLEDHLAALEATRDASREIVVSRRFEAPRERVWSLWTDPEHVSRWWGPRGFTTTTHEWDLSPDGSWLFTMHGPDGTDYANRVDFREIEPPSRLAYDHMGDGENNDVHFKAEVRFAAEAGGTRVTMRMDFGTPQMRAHVEEFGAVEGGVQTLERFGELLQEQDGGEG
jgi:uncharacterized protein YndB with AHSA1/START domain